MEALLKLNESSISLRTSIRNSNREPTENRNIDQTNVEGIVKKVMNEEFKQRFDEAIKPIGKFV